MSLSIAVVTVAYNAERCIARHLEALFRQTRQPQEVIVIDNGSNDRTSDLLGCYPLVTVLKMKENLGMAGAWSAGLAYAALKRRHDWIWSFDDDTVPDSKALELLLNGIKALSFDSDVGIVAPLPTHEETGTVYPPLLWHEGFVRPSADLVKQPIWFADLVIASGCLVRRDVIERIGLPRSEFFMDFFDFEYCLRARAHGYKIAVIGEAKSAHEIGNARVVRLLGFRRTWPDHAPWREYYIARNMTYSAWWLFPSRATKRFVVRYLMRHACGTLLFGSKKAASVQKIAQGFRDGRRARLGIRFRPAEQ